MLNNKFKEAAMIIRFVQNLKTLHFLLSKLQTQPKISTEIPKKTQHFQILRKPSFKGYSINLFKLWHWRLS